MNQQFPSQPRGRNWQSIGLAAAGGGILTAGILWWFIGDREKHEYVETIKTAIGQKLNEPDFSAVPPQNQIIVKPQTPIQPAQPAPSPQPPIPTIPKPPPSSPKQTAARPPQPPKPLSSMFATIDDAAALGRAGQQQQRTTQTEYRPGTSDGVDKLSEDQRQDLDAYKTRWLASASTNGDDFVSTPFAMPISKYMIQAGKIIRAVTLNEVNSDLPGDVVASVIEDITDTPTGTYLLIPAGSRLYGRYNNQLSYGQSRAQIAWTRILFTDGSSQNIGSMPGTDASGASGIEGDVDRHPWAMTGAIGLTAAMTVLSQTGAILQSGSGNDNGQTNIGIIGAGAAGQSAAQIGGQFVSRELNRKNTLIIRQGTEVAVMVSKDIALPPR